MAVAKSDSKNGTIIFTGGTSIVIARRRMDMPPILYPMAKIVNKFNAIEFSGGTVMVTSLIFDGPLIYFSLKFVGASYDLMPAGRYD